MVWDTIALESRNPGINFAGTWSDSRFDADNLRKSAPLSLSLNIWLREDRRKDIIDKAIICGRSFFVTTRGYFGIGPAEALIGDSVYILCGGPVPHVVRTCKKGDYVLIGECVVPRVMDGEVMDSTRSSDLQRLILR